MSTEDREIPGPDRFIDAVFGEGGYLSGALAGYRPRPGQVALCRAVDVAIRERGHLIAEGPTGTGKSLAYAVPASYHASVTGRQVVIVTANIALQEQIVTKDLPLLARVAPWKFTFASLKGRNNFLCIDRFYRENAGQWARQASLFEGSAIDRDDEQNQFKVLAQWADDSIRLGSGAGDVSELPFVPKPAHWRKLSVTSDECKHGRCAHAEDCFANRAATIARGSHVIVTNYHMFFAHLAVYMDAGVDAVIAPFEVAILDEAHKAADIARDFFGDRATVEGARRIAKAMRPFDSHVAGRLENTAGRLFGFLVTLRRDFDRYKARLTGQQLSEFELVVWRQLRDDVDETARVLQQQVARYTAIVEADPGDSDAADKLGDYEIDFNRAMRFRSLMQAAIELPNGDPDRVFFLEEDESKQRVAVVSKLIHAHRVLRPALFEKTVKRLMPNRQVEDGPPVAVVATSATLATDAGSFDYIAAEMGAPTGFRTLVAESPFDWEKQCLFVLPEGLPEPNAPEFRDAVAKTVERVVGYAGGRTLALFTSRKSMEHTYDSMIGFCKRNGITLLKQGDAPRTQLIERFKSDVTSVLLGNDSFWAGVDVPGEALSAVVIDRLPFPTPDDPIVDRMNAEDQRTFWTYSIPRSIIQFKQGFGRLIRSVNDRGVVVCLDNRIVSKKYGKQFLRALPNVPKTRKLEAIAEWLNPPREEAWDAS